MRGHAESDSPLTLGLKALAFLAGAQEDLQRFMAVSGADAATLRARADEPEFLAAVLDYLLANETLLVDFCTAESLEPREVHLAAARLGG
jgi:Protein of unknown function (DUF3572)